MAQRGWAAAQNLPPAVLAAATFQALRSAIASLATGGATKQFAHSVVLVERPNQPADANQPPAG